MIDDSSVLDLRGTACVGILLNSVPLTHHQTRTLHAVMANKSSLLRIGTLEIPLDIVAEIAACLVTISSEPGKDLHALFSTNTLLRAFGLDEQQHNIWQEAHDGQFDTLPQVLARLPLREGFSWRDLVLLRLATETSELARAARFVTANYDFCVDIRQVCC